MMLKLSGRVTAGLGEGSYYVKEYSGRIQEKLGFKPFFGTLNVRLNKVPDIRSYVTERIEKFKKEGKEFGLVELIPARILAGESTGDCYIVIPERNKHPDEIELISEFNLRDKFKLNEGDEVRIIIS